MTVLAENDRGILRFEGNELFVDSKVDDPPKVRLGSPGPGESLGGISGDRLRLSDGRRTERTLLQLKERTADRAGLYWFGGSDGRGEEDANMRTIAEVSFDAPFGAGPPTAGPDRMISADGRWVTVQQGDGNFVTYDTSGTTWRPVWSAWTGRIR